MIGIATVLLLLTPNARDVTAVPLPVWGAHGHTIAARARCARCRRRCPRFRDAEDQLAYLNPEPDRWRDTSVEPPILYPQNLAADRPLGVAGIGERIDRHITGASNVSAVEWLRQKRPVPEVVR